MTRSVYCLSLASTVAAPPVQLFQSSPAEASEIFWMSNDSIAYLSDVSLYRISITQAGKGEAEREHLLDFPVGVKPSSLKYEPTSGVLGFIGMVWDDGSFENVAKKDEAWEKRGHTGIVWDDWPIR